MPNSLSGLSHVPKLYTNYSKIFRRQEYSKLADLVALISILTFAIYHLGLYLMRKKETSTLFFAVTCFLISLRAITHSNLPSWIYFKDYPEVWAKLASIPTVTGGIIMFEFVRRSLGAGNLNRFHKLYYGVGIGLLLLILAMPYSIFREFILLFELHVSIGILLILTLL